MNIFLIILVVFALGLLSTAALWVQYLAVMHLEAARDAGKLPDATLPYAKAVLYFGLFWDFSYNIIFATIIFLDFPREWVVTSRLERYKYGSGTAAWRLKLTNWFASVLLDPFDPSGLHVHP